MDLEARARQVIDDHLFEAFWESVDHLGTTDLVLCLDTTVPEKTLQVFVREQLIQDPEAPAFLKRKFARPAREVARKMKDASTSFWLMIAFPDEQVLVLALHARQMSPGGQA
jgi:hypothetical protein